MKQPSARELLAKFQKIEEQEAKEAGLLNEETGPEATQISKGEEQKITSKDDHSGKVEQKREQGSENAEEEFKGSDKEVETKTGNERDEGSEKAEQEYTGSEKPISDDFKHNSGSNKTVPAAEGAQKEFSNYRSKIRAALRGGLVSAINKPEFKGNDGLNK